MGNSVESNPKTAQDLEKMGHQLLNEGRVNEAIRSFSKAQNLEPDSAWHYQNLALAAGCKGWTLAAINFFRMAHDLNSTQVSEWHKAHLPSFASDAPVPSPVFILGCPHSGTTILTRLIQNHSSIWCPVRNESHVFARFPNRIDETIRQWDKDCLDNGKNRWADKSISHSFQVPWLIAARPKARFIVSVRDGRDVVASLKRRKGEYRSLDDLIDQWVQSNLALLPYLKNSSFLWVKYEDLVTEPSATLKTICGHIGEEFESTMLDYHNDPIDWNAIEPQDNAKDVVDRKSIRQHKTWQINQPLFDGRGRWESELTDDEKQQLKEKIQPHLEEFGYVENDRW